LYCTVVEMISVHFLSMKSYSVLFPQTNDRIEFLLGVVSCAVLLFFNMMELTGEGRACIPVGPKMVLLTELSVFEK